jgi:hypothetical protein
MQRLLRKLEDYRIMGIPEERRLMRSHSFSCDARGIVFPMDQIKHQLD